jgi:hypothetical protein
LSLSVEPAVPGKGKALEVIAKGVRESQPTEESPSASTLGVFLNVGREPCAPTYELEIAKTSKYEGYTIIGGSESNKPNGPFEVRGRVRNIVMAGPPWKLDNGVQTGRYRLCGYLFDSAKDPDGVAPPQVLTRLDFTAGGTCASSTAKVAKARKALRKANKALKRARSAGNARRLKQAKSKVKKAKRSLKRARSGRKALC